MTKSSIALGSLSSATSRSGTIAAALLLGLTLIFAAGFLPTAAAHNAAHDSRHSHAFPCH